MLNIGISGSVFNGVKFRAEIYGSSYYFGSDIDISGNLALDY